MDKEVRCIADEVPFEIPDSWEWIHLQDVAHVNGGMAFKSVDFSQIGTRVIRISDFNENGFVNKKIVRHPYSEIYSPYLLEIKNIILCMTGGTVGKSLPKQMISEQISPQPDLRQDSLHRATIRARYSLKMAVSGGRASIKVFCRMS